jgi:hypoxanthine phosphoribosyltransferase
MSQPKPPTVALHPDLAEVLLTEGQIRERIKTLAREIKAAYGDGELTIISLINGAVMFTADLMREIDNPVRLDCIRVSSYGAKTSRTATSSSSTTFSTPARRSSS